MAQQTPQLVRQGDHWQGSFSAMASPCELLIESCPQQLAEQLFQAAVATTKRIEQKFSRYRDDSVCQQINTSHGEPVTIDEETYQLLSFADTCYQLSDGLFDITSGVLRNIWHFDGGRKLPTQQQIDHLLPLIGWEKVSFDEQSITLPKGMEIDLGGIGKEYAVDKVAAEMAAMAPKVSVLVNFGGDIAVSVPKASGGSWKVGFELDSKSKSPSRIEIKAGGLATSGDKYRFLQKNGVRYAHILNPKTGWPARNAPAQITVAGMSCVQAGIISTIAMLQGVNAKAFLKQQEVPFWVVDSTQ